MIIYETSDRIKLKVDTLEFEVSPLPFLVKSKIQALVIQGDALGAAAMAMKHGIKSVKGLKKKDQSDYQLELVNDVLSDKTIDTLMNIKHSQTLITICMNLIVGMPEKQFVDAEGKALEGVSIVEDSEKK